MRIDRSDDGGERPDAADARGAREAGTPVAPGARGGDAPVAPGARGGDAPVAPGARGGDAPVARGAEAAREADAAQAAGPDRGTAAEWPGGNRGDEASAVRAERSLEYRAKVERAERAHAIDQGYARVKEIEEKTVTPAMRRIEASDPSRHLAGLEHRLKGKDRLTEKVEKWLSAQPDLRLDDAFKLVKDAIRYTFVYSEERYTEGVYADCDRLESAGFAPVDRQNSWKEDQYKGINSRWREPGSRMLFEVQFHTQESIDAKELTHPAYERIRDPATPPDEVRELRALQSEVCSRLKIPQRATEIPDYSYPQEG